MPAEQLALFSTDFSAAWCATDLGEYRACSGTYERYPCESLPPLDPSRCTGEPFVVFSGLDYEYEYEARRDGRRTQSDLGDAQEQRAAICWCAPSFGEFAYRFWIENSLRRAIHSGGLSGLAPELRDYLRFYADGKALA